jgi:hypothetical protein
MKRLLTTAFLTLLVSVPSFAAGGCYQLRKNRSQGVCESGEVHGGDNGPRSQGRRETPFLTEDTNGGTLHKER